jgi:predicted transposase/invertase (TIGR01784 family)
MDIKEEELLNWLRVIRSEDLEEIEMLATKSPEMKKTVTIIKKLSADERTRLEYEDREKAMRDYLSLTEDSKEEGRIEGRIEGKIEMAKIQLSLGVPVDIIAQSSDMSVDEITALRDQFAKDSVDKSSGS